MLKHKTSSLCVACWNFVFYLQISSLASENKILVVKLKQASWGSLFKKPVRLQPLAMRLVLWTFFICLLIDLLHMQMYNKSQTTVYDKFVKVIQNRIFRSFYAVYNHEIINIMSNERLIQYYHVYLF